MTPEEHWDNEWNKRIKDNHHSVMRNVEKLGKIIYELCKRSEYRKMGKIEIGCGPASHVLHLRNIFKDWDKTFTGIDLSKVAVEYGKAHGLNMIHGDFLEYQTDKKYDVFIFLDSLEHIFDHQKLAEKIKELASPKYYIVGNVPLYPNAYNKDPGLEREMNIDVLMKFMRNSGLACFTTDIYGVYGYPYCFFEGMNV